MAKDPHSWPDLRLCYHSDGGIKNTIRGWTGCYVGSHQPGMGLGGKEQSDDCSETDLLPFPLLRNLGRPLVFLQRHRQGLQSMGIWNSPRGSRLNGMRPYLARGVSEVEWVWH